MASLCRTACLTFTRALNRGPVPLPAPQRLVAVHSASSSPFPTMASLEQARIIPDVIDRVSSTIKAQLEVAFKGRKVQNGEFISPQDAASTPTAHIKGGTDDGLYTLVSSDPDAPDPANPIRGEWLHWIVTNIPANSDASKGNEVVSYMGPAPPIGDHRYIFLLYQQPNQEPLQVEDPSKGDKMGRANFKVRKFAQEHNLGDPVAVTWFVSHK